MRRNQDAEFARPLVMKFGGTSVGSADAIRGAVEIIGQHVQQRAQLVVVVSAMRGMTEALLNAAHAAASDGESLSQAVEWIESRNAQTIRDLFPAGGPERASLEQALDHCLEVLADLCSRIAEQGAQPHLIDAVSSLGERLNARLVSAVLARAGVPSTPVDATGLIVTNRNFQNASPLDRPTRRAARQALHPLFAAGIVPVVTGFIGAARDGRTTTLGRGGSDYTATILGAGLDAAEVWIWTDVAGVMTADPRLVPEAAVVSRIGYAEVHELANFGGRVLHPKTILPVRKRGIPIRVRHTFDPAFPGTLILDDRSGPEPGDLIVSLLAGCRWHERKAALVRDSASPLIPVRPYRAGRWGNAPVSVISLVGRAACSGSLKSGVYEALDQHRVDVLATSETSARNRFSLVVPSDRAPDALRMIHNEVLCI